MFFITSFYQFSPWGPEQAGLIKTELESICAELGIEGLVLVAPEGINATVSAASTVEIDSFKLKIRALSGCDDVLFKDSLCETAPFRRLRVDLREEIVTYDPAIVPAPEDAATHLSPAEWHRVLSEEQDFILLDTRNWYEVELGRFKGCVDPEIDQFTDLRGFVERQDLPKEKKLLMYCTGGVRCEKAARDLRQLGFKNVFQLHGGILKYFEEFPEGHFQGECFVFDHRVAVDAKLNPTQRYRFCPHCGQPGDLRVVCIQCTRSAVICEECGKDRTLQTCSKNCAHHAGRKLSVETRNSSDNPG